MRIILTYLKRYKKLFVMNVLSVFGFALAELGIPTIVAQMVDQGVTHHDQGYLLQMGGVIAVISVLGVAGTILLGYCCAKISTSITRDIRNDIFTKVQHFSHQEFNTFGVSSLITRPNYDVCQCLIADSAVGTGYGGVKHDDDDPCFSAVIVGDWRNDTDHRVGGKHGSENL